MAYERKGHSDYMYIVDSIEDLKELTQLSMGSSAKVIDTGDTYIINSKGEWKLQPNQYSLVTAQKFNGSISLSQIDEIQYHGNFNLFVVEGCDNYFYDYDGTIIEAREGRVMSNFIPCQAGQKITRNGNLTNVICYFDAKKNFLYRKDGKNLSTIIVPNDPSIAYIRLAVVISPDLTIVYGTSINQNEFGDYYTIPKLKINENNLKENGLGYYTSPNGTSWKIIVDDYGNLHTEKISAEAIIWPENFPVFTVSGKLSNSNEEILLTPHGKFDVSYIFSIDFEGNLKRYKKLNHGASNFKAIKYKDGTIRYSYFKTIEKLDNAYWRSSLVILDEDWNVVAENIESPTGNPVNGHGYYLIADNHYILAVSPNVTVTNVPGYENQPILLQDLIIQEVKNNECIWTWTLSEHPELYNICRYYSLRGSWEEQLSENNPNRYLDFSHFNSIDIDKNTGDYLVSLRYIGLIKIEKQTGQIKWVLGKYRNDFMNSLPAEDVCYLQHNAQILPDNSITVFSNNEGTNNSIHRYWIDENLMTMIKYETFITPEASCHNYGSATLIDDTNNTYLISYGDPSEIAVEEYCFNNNTSNFKLKFEGQGIYSYIASPMSSII